MQKIIRERTKHLKNIFQKQFECHLKYTQMQINVLTANPCGLEPCKNGAKCFNEGEKFRCVCTAGFEGLTCVQREYCFYF